MPRFRMRYDEDDLARARAAVCVREFDRSLTQQSHAVDCDLNVLLKRFGVAKDGVIPVLPYPVEAFGEETELDLREALDMVRDAQAHFAALPSALRSRFDNSPAKLWDFVNNPANADEAIKLGLLKRDVPPVSEVPNAEA